MIGFFLDFFFVMKLLLVLPNRRTCELDPEMVNAHITFSLLLKSAGILCGTGQHAKQQMLVYRTQWVCFCKPVGVNWLDHPAHPVFLLSVLFFSLGSVYSCCHWRLKSQWQTIKVLLFSQGRLLLCGLALPDCPSSNKTSSTIICDSLTYVSPFLFSTSCGC